MTCPIPRDPSAVVLDQSSLERERPKSNWMFSVSLLNFRKRDAPGLNFLCTV